MQRTRQLRVRVAAVVGLAVFCATPIIVAAAVPFISQEVQPTAGQEGAHSVNGTHMVNNSPVFIGRRHKDNVDPDPDNPTVKTEAEVGYGEVDSEVAQQLAYGQDGRIMIGQVGTVPPNATIKWRVHFAVQHEDVAEAKNAPGNPTQGTYSAVGQSWSGDIKFEILNASEQPLNPVVQQVSARVTKKAERKANDSGKDSIPKTGDDGKHEFGTVASPHVLALTAGTDKARLKFNVEARIECGSTRSPVVVGARSKVYLLPGGKIEAWDYTDPLNPVILKQSDGVTDASWDIR